MSFLSSKFFYDSRLSAFQYEFCSIEGSTVGYRCSRLTSIRTTAYLCFDFSKDHKSRHITQILTQNMIRRFLMTFNVY